MLRTHSLKVSKVSMGSSLHRSKQEQRDALVTGMDLVDDV